MRDLVERGLSKNKSGLLEYYRGRASELITEVKRTFSNSEYKERASAVNKGLTDAHDNLVKIIEQKSKTEHWSAKDILEAVLMATYTNYIVMMESRNDVWAYDYMTFSRRIGELWEPFCQLCWTYSIKRNIEYFIPPLFKDVKEKLTEEIDMFIDGLSISKKDKKQLRYYYKKVWGLVSSGEIKLELDLHFKLGDKRYVIDFKSGFSSNEKGNTNRLLLVASIYKILEEKYNCLIFVRSEEESNNHYLQTLKKSGLWTVCCGKETYKKIKEFTGYDLASWLKGNVNWKKDFDRQMYDHLKKSRLVQYLQW